MVLACAIIVFGLMATVDLSSKTLTSSTIHFKGATIRIEIFEQDGLLYVSAREHQAWSNGWEAIRLLGSLDSVETESATISADGGDRVQIQVGKQTIEFDIQSRSYEFR